jgi:hypothetical protein
MAVFFVLFLLAVTWPGYVFFNRISPSIGGLPLSFAWPALWIVMGFFVLILLDRSESRAEDNDDEDRPEGQP